MRRMVTTIIIVVLVLILIGIGIFNMSGESPVKEEPMPEVGDTREALLSYLEASDYTYTRVVTHTEDGVRYSYSVTTPSLTYTYITDNSILSIF